MHELKIDTIEFTASHTFILCIDTSDERIQHITNIPEEGIRHDKVKKD